MILTEEWMRDGACYGPYVDADLFHPADNEAVRARDARERKARAICNRCPVKTECLTFSLNPPGISPERGFWGGLNYEQRQIFKRRMARRAA